MQNIKKPLHLTTIVRLEKGVKETRNYRFNNLVEIEIGVFERLSQEICVVKDNICMAE